MATINRDHLLRLVERAEEFGVAPPEGEGAPDFSTMGVEEKRITTAVDVQDFLDTKRRAMAAHASQISEASFFLTLPPAAFALVWGTEWYIRVDAAAGAEMETTLVGDP